MLSHVLDVILWTDIIELTLPLQAFPFDVLLFLTPPKSNMNGSLTMDLELLQRM